MMTPDTAQDPAAAVDHRRRLLHRSQYGNHDRGCRQPGKYNSVSAGSALSRSMRYADDWLYERDAATGCGTVGHGGGGRKARSTFFGREHFGTAAVVAIAAAAAVTANAVKPAAAAAQDPYDRVRKNRMAGVSAGNAGGGHLPDRKRNGSSGGGGETSRTPSPDYYDDGTAGVSSHGRRSILECDVNPYDLLRRQSDDDDNDDCDDCDDGPPRRMSLKDKFMSRIQDTVVFTKNRTSIGGFSSFSAGGSGKKTTADRNHGGVLIAGHTVSEQRSFHPPPHPNDGKSVFPETALFPRVIRVT